MVLATRTMPRVGLVDGGVYLVVVVTKFSYNIKLNIYAVSSVCIIVKLNRFPVNQANLDKI